MRLWIAVSVALVSLTTATVAPAQSFEEAAKASKPLAPRPVPQTLGTSTIKAERCRIVGAEYLGLNSTRLFDDIAISGKRLYLTNDDGAVQALRIQSTAPCTLAVDKTFGTAGVRGTKHVRHEALARDKAGKVYASGTLADAVIFDSTGARDCKVRGNLAPHASGAWGAAVASLDGVVRIVDIGASGCTASDWMLKASRKDEERKGPFSGLQTVNIVGDTLFVAGKLATAVNADTPNVVIAYDKSGKELFRFGNQGKGITGETFGYVQNVHACKQGLCAFDPNYRKLVAFTTEGKYVAHIDLQKLFDLRYPWISDLTIGEDGAAWFVAAQDRTPAKVAEALVYRVTGF